MRTATKALLLSVTLALAGSSAVAEPLRIALVPPQDFEPTLSHISAAGAMLSVDVDTLTPEQLVDPNAFNAAKYPLAVYAGKERYCYTVKGPGDGAEALLRYVREGGVLLVAGLCWPFYRPVDYFGGQWLTSKGELPTFRADADEYLVKQMKQLDQSSVGNFNRYLGLNIAGEGTQQFERPEESVTLKVVSRELRDVALPAGFPFPGSGSDLRFRPASSRTGLPNFTFEPLVTAVGESGTEYGAAMALIRHNAQGPKPGTVYYVWGTLMATNYAPAITREVIRLAAKQSSTSDDRAVMGRLRQRLQTLADMNSAVVEALDGAPQDTPALSYMTREADALDAILGGLKDTILVRNYEAVEQGLEDAEKSVTLLKNRVTALTPQE